MIQHHQSKSKYSGRDSNFYNTFATSFDVMEATTTLKQAVKSANAHFTQRIVPSFMIFLFFFQEIDANRWISK